MKLNKVVLGLLVLTSTLTFSQTQIKKDSLSVSKAIGFEESFFYEGVEIKFKSVVSDSRCPKEVMCVQAGEAKVLVSIYKDGTFLRDEDIYIHASGFVSEEVNTLFSSEGFKIFAFGLSPYPTAFSQDKMKQENYTLELLLQPLGI